MEYQTEQSRQNQSFRPEIQGLRAIAILAVIINHFNSWLMPSGFLGVDIFFVISGFVITSSLSQKAYSNTKDRWLVFYKKRIERLLPSLIICVLIVSLVAGLFIYPWSRELHNSLITGISSLFGISNLYLLKNSTDYFGTSAELNLFTHTWALGVEQQFYLVYPFALGLSSFNTEENSKKNFNFILFACILSVTAYIYTGIYKSNFAFYMMPTRFWELGLGYLTFIFMQKDRGKWLKKNKEHLGFFSLPILVLIMFSIHDYQVIKTIIVAFLTSILIWSLDENSLFSKYLSWIGLVFVGNISYSLYLWHWPIIVISRWTIGITPVTIPFQVLLIVVLSLLSYYQIEKRFRFSSSVKQNFVKSLTTFVLFLFTVSTVIYLYKNPSAIYLGEAQEQKSTHSNNDSRFSGSNCHLASRSGISRINTDLIEKCTIIASNEEDSTIFILGNSYGNHLRPLLKKLSEYHGFGLDGITQSECFFPSSDNQKEICDELQKLQYTRILESIKANDIIVISNSITQELDELFVEAVYKKGGKIIIFMPLPRFSYPGTLCTPEWFKNGKWLSEICTVDKAELIKRFKDSYATITNLNPKVLKYNPLDILCPDNECQIIDSNTKEYLFVDGHHLSSFGAEYLYPSFSEFLIKENLL